MLRLSVRGLKPGMKIAKTLYSSSGKVILPARLVLDFSLIEKVRRSGISYLWIEDERVADVKVEELIRFTTRFFLLREMQKLFQRLQKVIHEGTSSDSSPKKVIQGDLFMNYAERMVEEIDRIEDTTILSHDKEITLTEITEADEFLPVTAVNTAMLALVIGKAFRPGRGPLKNLVLASLVCDLGMVRLPREVLSKEKRLTEKEWELIKVHPAYTIQLMKEHSTLPPSLHSLIEEHHERLDGSGYPKGLKGGKIDLFSQIIGISNTYAALVSPRPWRKAHLPHEAIECILALSDEGFSHELVEKFVRLVPSYPKGVMVELNTGEAGCVVDPKRGYIARPVIRVLYDREGREVLKPYEIDLSLPKHQTKMITRVLEE